MPHNHVPQYAVAIAAAAAAAAAIAAAAAASGSLLHHRDRREMRRLRAHRFEELREIERHLPAQRSSGAAHREDHRAAAPPERARVDDRRL